MFDILNNITSPMSSIAPTREEFDTLLQHVKDPVQQEKMFLCDTPYDRKSAYLSFVPNEAYFAQEHLMHLTLHKMLNVVQQLAVRPEFEGFKRQEVIDFISLFKGYLNPSFESATVHTMTFGEEARRLLNQMAFDMARWGQ